MNLTDGGAISGATTATLTISAAALTDDGAAFDAVVTNTCGSARSDPAGLGVTASCIGDTDADGDTDSDDIIAFFAAWDSGC